MKNTEYKDVYDFSEEALSIEKQFAFPKFPSINTAFNIGETIRGMSNVSPLATVKFFNQTTDSIFKKYYPDAQQIQKGNSNLVLDENKIQKNGYEFYLNEFYSDKKRNGNIDDDPFAFKLLLFVSTDGNKVKECYEVVQPADDEIIFFIETDDDTFSNDVMYGRASERIKRLYTDQSTGKIYSSFFEGDLLQEINKKAGNVNKDIIEELFFKGYIEKKGVKAGFANAVRTTLMGLSYPSKAIGWACNKLGDGLDFLKISDKFWDTEDENYYFQKDKLIENLTISTTKLQTLKNIFTEQKDINTYNFPVQILDAIILSQISAMEEFVEEYNNFVKAEIEEIFKTLENPQMQEKTQSLAEKVALICGAWNGIVDFVSSIFKFVGGLLEAPFNIVKDVQYILEIADNFIQMLREKSFIPNVKKAINESMKQMVQYLKNKETDDINWVRLHYIGGFTLAFIGTFFVPLANVAKIANIGKLGEILAKINGEVGKVVYQTAKFVKVETAQAYQKVAKSLQWLLDIFRTGGQKLQEFFNDIWKEIAEWFLKNKKLIEGWANKIKQYLSKDGKTEEFFRKIAKKFNPVGEEILSANELKNLRRLLKETFDVTIQFVDQNPALRAKLKDWTARRVAGSFNMVEGVMYLRKSVTAYTVQHEMFHMKLWYKMTKEFPELQPLFQKTLGKENRLFHEEYVLAEFMKNPSKWKDEDLLNDLNFINKNLRKPKGLPDVDLDYYKKWNLQEELLKFK